MIDDFFIFPFIKLHQRDGHCVGKISEKIKEHNFRLWNFQDKDVLIQPWLHEVLISMGVLIDIDAKRAVRSCRWLKSFQPIWKLHDKFSAWFLTCENYWSGLASSEVYSLWWSMIVLLNYDCQWRQLKNSWSGLTSSDYTIYGRIC